MEFKSPIINLKNLQTKNGLFLAAPSEKTGYNKAWIRDNIYASLSLELFYREECLRVIHRIFDILKKHEYKIDWAIKDKPKHPHQYIHARYNPETLEEFWEEWGNKQNDAIGAFLFRVADLISKGFSVLRNNSDKKILQKLIDYLGSIEYWHDADNGMWEEHEEIHASSVGACLAGLIAISKYFNVQKKLIDNGRKSLNSLLPRESKTKDVDLALLSLIYPHNIVNEKQRKQILKNVEAKLVRKRGIIRYKGDKYYYKNGEAEWTMGFPWLAIIYKLLGDRKKYLRYISKTLECLNESSELPELYYSNTEEHNENSPLSWAQSLYIVAVL
ncbi:glycoside hydrolase family 15 [Candidatus Pacearchaeota archaeon]|nr:glycoside hydrolase family 15 [Candidatus Pacearchaeota archaeon]